MESCAIMAYVTSALVAWPVIARVPQLSIARRDFLSPPTTRAAGKYPKTTATSTLQ
jgi:hypothetical protein